jgi:hypothetical protein
MRPPFAAPWIGRLAVSAVMLWLVVARPVSGQTVELRAGLASSTALVEDAIANPLLIAALEDAWQGPVRAEPAVGLALTLIGATPLRGRSALELSVGWASSRLDAADAAGTREIQDLGVGHATLGVRYSVAGPAEAACGFGVLRYFADGGLFEGGAGLSPLVECGTGVRWGTARRAFTVRATAQAHRFRTPLLRDAGAQSGTVLRLAVQAGIALGRRP